MRIDKHYDLPFSPIEVYEAWVCTDCVIPPATRLDIRPEVGGHYRLYMELEDRCSRAEGLFFTVEPERRLRYTWEWDRDGEITEVDVTFADQGNSTRLKIRHTGFRQISSRESHAQGWDDYVRQLSAIIRERAKLPASA